MPPPVTAEGERWRLLHVTAGYTVAGLVVFRLLWGVFGTRHARFTDFVRGPRAVWQYVRSLAAGHPEHHTGHNPAGALAILALLALALLTTATGIATDAGIAGEWAEDVHEVPANLMLAVVMAHVLAVIAGSWVHHENLVGAMIHGYKPVPPQEGIRSAWRSVAALMLVAVLGFWWLQWQSAPADLLGGAHADAAEADDD